MSIKIEHAGYGNGIIVSEVHRSFRLHLGDEVTALVKGFRVSGKIDRFCAGADGIGYNGEFAFTNEPNTVLPLTWITEVNGHSVGTETTAEHRLIGVVPFGESVKALLFGELHKLAGETVKQFQSDFYHDVNWINEHITGPCFFYYSFNESGTLTGFNLESVRTRENVFHIALILKPSQYQEGGEWSARITKVEVPQ